MINEVRFEIVLQNIVYITNAELKGLAYDDNTKKFYVYYSGTINPDVQNLCNQLVQELFNTSYSVVFQSVP